MSAADARAHNSAMPNSAPEPKPSLEPIRITRSRATDQATGFLTAITLVVTILVTVIVLLIQLKSAGVATEHDSLSLLIRGSWGVVGFSAAVGIASAGAIQIVKQLAGVRGYFQRIWVFEWMGSRISNESLWNRWLIDNSGRIAEIPDGVDAKIQRDSLALGVARVQRERAASELEEALLGGLSARELLRVFDLPTEQLCAQIGIAADQAMSRPNDYAELLLALTGPAGLKRIDVLAPPSIVFPDGQIVRERGREDLDEENTAFEPDENDMAYPLVAQGVRAGVDMLQISLGQRWRRGIQWSAVVVSGILGVIGAFLLGEPVTAQVLLGVSALVLGGSFAWLARDLVAIVERARR